MKAKIAKYLLIAFAVSAAVQLRAGIKVGAKEVKEWVVAFRSPKNWFVSTRSPGNQLFVGGMKIGSQQTFTLIDLNGEDIVDGDEIKIRYTPNKDGVPDPSKSSYWVEIKDGIKRGKEGDVFKLKKVDSKFAIQAPSGNFMTATSVEGVLAVTNNLDGAVMLDILDISAGRDAPKLIGQPAGAEQPKASESATPVKPAATPAPAEKAAPAEKPAAQ